MKSKDLVVAGVARGKSRGRGYLSRRGLTGPPGHGRDVTFPANGMDSQNLETSRFLHGSHGGEVGLGQFGQFDVGEFRFGDLDFRESLFPEGGHVVGLYINVGRVQGWS